jgi:hypothetical protein
MATLNTLTNHINATSSHANVIQGVQPTIVNNLTPPAQAVNVPSQGMNAAHVRGAVFNDPTQFNYSDDEEDQGCSIRANDYVNQNNTFLSFHGQVPLNPQASNPSSHYAPANNNDAHGFMNQERPQALQKGYSGPGNYMQNIDVAQPNNSRRHQPEKYVDNNTYPNQKQDSRRRDFSPQQDFSAGRHPIIEDESLGPDFIKGASKHIVLYQVCRPKHISFSTE